MKVSSACLFILVSLVGLHWAHPARVSINAGDLEGSEYINNNGKQIFTFLGVPYAKPPVGNNRFKEPKPLTSWYGVWPAKEFSPSCLQFIPDFEIPGHISGDEDCLYLNIYTPSISDTSNLPVLVYIHGGAFMFGEGSLYKPTHILEMHDIVFVSINYRLGAFGFLSTQDNEVPGNNGMKDQVLALKWVQDNIAYFGGDKNKVTIAGNSAGGSSVHYHYLSPLSRGLFDKGISSSGSALMPWAFTEEPLQKAKQLADSLACPTDSTEIMVKCLKQRPSKQICFQTKKLFQPWLFNPYSPFGPVVESSSKQSFLTEHPYEILSKGNVYDRPWLTSITTEEGLYPVALFIDREDLLKSLNDNWNYLAPHLLDYNYTVPHGKRDFVSDKIKSFYFGNADVSIKTQDKVIEMASDRLFSAEMGHAIRVHASTVTSPVFFFTFAYRGAISLSDSMSKTKGNFGVSHFDDIYYLLSYPGYAPLLESEADKAMMAALINIWASYIKTGHPSSPAGTEWNPIKRDLDTAQLTYLLIESHDKMVSTATENIGNYNFWTSLGLHENVKYNTINVKDEL